ncbi:hypothetical protein QQ054_09350 [Oscillatoria amoena NRMC-F 0135]|nr:hypothetical protein [Oscillatoria amoena NRMC-F 0135]
MKKLIAIMIAIAAVHFGALQAQTRSVETTKGPRLMLAPDAAKSSCSPCKAYKCSSKKKDCGEKKCSAKKCGTKKGLCQSQVWNGEKRLRRQKMLPQEKGLRRQKMFQSEEVRRQKRVLIPQPKSFYKKAGIFFRLFLCSESVAVGADDRESHFILGRHDDDHFFFAASRISAADCSVREIFSIS